MVGENRPVHVAGNSLGAAVAMRLLALRPQGKLLLHPSRAGALRNGRCSPTAGTCRGSKGPGSSTTW
ncbi:pimeloyl-ACP methyl ester carboxylesterase [Amycolatopsis granulosa]|nr:pimeloyl-ACP methyl ester carboxylesterase [Amycolatopsis granulosa]